MENVEVCPFCGATLIDEEAFEHEIAEAQKLRLFEMTSEEMRCTFSPRDLEKVAKLLDLLARRLNAEVEKDPNPGVWSEKAVRH